MQSTQLLSFFVQLYRDSNSFLLFLHVLVFCHDCSIGIYVQCYVQFRWKLYFPQICHMFCIYLKLKCGWFNGAFLVGGGSCYVGLWIVLGFWIYFKSLSIPLS